MVITTNYTIQKKMTSSCISVLRIGGPLGSEESISIFQTELSNHFPFRRTDKQRLLISNKYFTATVQLCPLFHDENEKRHLDEVPSNDIDGDNDGGDDDNVKNDCVFREDGILLIFPSNGTQIETLTELHDRILQSNALVGDTLRLCIATCVGNTSTYTTKEHQEEYSKRVLWCLDRGYEYVEVDLSEEGLKEGFDEREKDGFARVVEAIGGTVWSSAVMMKRDDIKAVASIGDGEVSEATISTRENNVAAFSVAKAANDVHDDGGADKKKKKNETIDDSVSTTNSNEESVLENIEHIMEEAKRIRECSRAGQLSDEERRNRAGNAAEVLMGLLDQMGVYDDVDTDSDCSDQSMIIQ
jgi:hypothetical protein